THAEKNVKFQDDANAKQRAKIALETVNELFIDRISPQEDDAKFADVWPIGNIWGILKKILYAQNNFRVFNG
ncbi:unnamed protein product, partial [Rotaria socialis]